MCMSSKFQQKKHSVEVSPCAFLTSLKYISIFFPNSSFDFPVLFLQLGLTFPECFVNFDAHCLLKCNLNINLFRLQVLMLYDIAWKTWCYLKHSTPMWLALGFQTQQILCDSLYILWVSKNISILHFGGYLKKGSPQAL